VFFEVTNILQYWKRAAIYCSVLEKKLL